MHSSIEVEIILLQITEAAVNRCSLEKVFWKYAANLQQNSHAEVRFNKVALQLYWNRTSTWVLSSKFVAYFLNTFS